MGKQESVKTNNVDNNGTIFTVVTVSSFFLRYAKPLPRQFCHLRLPKHLKKISWIKLFPRFGSFSIIDLSQSKTVEPGQRNLRFHLLTSFSDC